MTFARRVRSLRAEPVALTGTQVGQVAVPHEVGAVGQPDALLARSLRVEEAQLDSAGVLAVDRDVDAVAVPRDPEGIGRPAPDPHRFGARRASASSGSQTQSGRLAAS